MPYFLITVADKAPNIIKCKKMCDALDNRTLHAFER